MWETTDENIFIYLDLFIYLFFKLKYDTLCSNQEILFELA